MFIYIVLRLSFCFFFIACSGGITRDWIGVPRKYFPPGAKQELCVCVRTSGPPSDNPTSQTDVGDLENPYLHLYERCDALSNSCQIIE